MVINNSRAKEFFGLLEQARAEIDAQVGDGLVWYNPPERKMSKVYRRRPANLENRADWPNQHAWLQKELEALHKAFASRIRALQLPPVSGGPVSPA
jgi:hypothetical protein